MDLYIATRSCPKCNNVIITDKYNYKKDIIERGCTRCSYRWSEYPLNRRQKEKIGRVK